VESFEVLGFAMLPMPSVIELPSAEFAAEYQL